MYRHWYIFASWSSLFTGRIQFSVRHWSYAVEHYIFLSQGKSIKIIYYTFGIVMQNSTLADTGDKNKLHSLQHGTTSRYVNWLFELWPQRFYYAACLFESTVGSQLSSSRVIPFGFNFRFFCVVSVAQFINRISDVFFSKSRMHDWWRLWK